MTGPLQGDRSPATRRAAFGRDHALTLMDRTGNWLSERFVRREVRSFEGKHLLDIGCGHEAALVRRVLPQLASATLVDLTLADDLKRQQKVRAVEGRLPHTLDDLAEGTYDVVLCINVLEHLWDPAVVLSRTRALLKADGVCIVNVPSWSGKVVLEAAAFKFGLTTRTEIDDHKAYYDTRQLWQLAVRAGFLPSQIRCRAHKFGLNVCAVCRAS
jgi:SAM-dependent methyltransferase